MAITVTSRGRVRIPKPVLDYMGLIAGGAVEFQMMPDGRVMMQAVDRSGLATGRPSDRFAALRGSAGRGLSTDEIMALTRG